MTNPTSNFNWQMPTSSDLVTDLPADFEVFGQAVDTSLADLKGGTTGQVLSKASNTDMDFTWVAADDTNAIQNAIVDAKGDLIAASAADTPARLAVGADGSTLVANSAAATGLSWAMGNAYAAGKNKIINGDFSIWQRGTTFNSIASSAFAADRWVFGTVGDVVNVTRQTFTPADITSIGYGDSQFFMRMEVVSSNGSARAEQKIENVRTFANQNVTVSFWAKASTSTNLDVLLYQNFGSGGSTQVNLTAEVVSLTTSWVRYSKTFAVPSVSGKTIGDGSHLALSLRETSASTNVSFDFWGVQVESGSVATPFATATGTIQGELAACQRYYYRTVSGGAYTVLGLAATTSTTAGTGHLQLPVSMRTTPSAIDFSSLGFILPSNNTTYAISSATLNTTLTNGSMLGVDFVVATTTSSVLGRFAINNSATGYLGCSAEL